MARTKKGTPTPSGEFLQSLGFTVKREDSTVYLTGTLDGMRDFVDRFDSLAWSVPGNEEAASAYMRARKVHWTGGSLTGLRESLRAGTDLSSYERQRDRLESRGLIEKLRTAVQEAAPRRKRRFDDIDGEFLLDRALTLQPFQRCYRESVHNRTVRIVANFAASAACDADKLDRYGATVWAIVQGIESSGVLTEVVLRYANRPLTRCGLAGDFQITLKTAGQFVAPGDLAAAFTTNFYRRAVFSLYAVATDSLGLEVSRGRIPYQADQGIEYRDGELHLAPSISSGLPDDLAREISAAITGSAT